MRELLLLITSACLFGMGCPTYKPLPTTGPIIASASSTASTVPGVRYILTSPAACASARYTCNADEEAFTDASGCGCKKKTGDDVPRACTKEYRPVCGEEVVYCIKAPCPPLRQTFGNRCMAEEAKAQNITEGECK